MDKAVIMDDKPLISIIMGIYNCADTLEEAVNCIINQTYTNWELIMCDDCSKDSTYITAQNLAKKDSRIIVLKNDENLTLAPTLNKCLEIAKGKYIARMDGDDICHATRLEKEVLFLENNTEFALVSCNMNLYDSEGTYKTIVYKDFPIINDLIVTSQFCHAGCMMKKNVLLELSGYNTSLDCKRIEDYDLWIRLYNRGYRGCNIQEALYSMRDDRKARRRRNLQNRINESKLKYKLYKDSKLDLKYSIHIFIPIIKYFLPEFIYQYFHKK